MKYPEITHPSNRAVSKNMKMRMKTQVYENKNAPSERTVSIVIVVYPRRWAQLAKPYYLLTQGSGLLSRGS